MNKRALAFAVAAVAVVAVGFAPDALAQAAGGDPTAPVRTRLNQFEQNAVLVLNATLGIFFLIGIGWSLVRRELQTNYMILIVGLAAALNGWAALTGVWG